MDLPLVVRRAMIGATLYTVVMSAGGIYWAWQKQELWKVPLNQLSRDEYLSREHQGYDTLYYPAVKYVNENLPQEAVVLFLGEERGFYCERRFVTSSVFDVNPLLLMAEASREPRHLLDALKQQGISHLLVNRAAARFKEAGARLSPRARNNIEWLLGKGSQLLFNDRHDVPGARYWVQVYRI